MPIKDIVLALAAHEEASAAFYRSFAKTVLKQNIRALILSVVDQKDKKVKRIRTFIETQADCCAGEMLPAQPLPSLPERVQETEEFLETLVSLETILSMRYGALVESVSGHPDAASLFQSLSEDSRKHASWAQDHLDLERLR
jgi:rubrerythrin